MNPPARQSAPAVNKMALIPVLGWGMRCPFFQVKRQFVGGASSNAIVLYDKSLAAADAINAAPLIRARSSKSNLG